MTLTPAQPATPAASVTPAGKRATA
jgi:hypothetical protein